MLELLQARLRKAGHHCELRFKVSIDEAKSNSTEDEFDLGLAADNVERLGVTAYKILTPEHPAIKKQVEIFLASQLTAGVAAESYGIFLRNAGNQESKVSQEAFLAAEADLVNRAKRLTKTSGDDDFKKFKEKYEENEWDTLIPLTLRLIFIEWQRVQRWSDALLKHRTITHKIFEILP